MDEPQGRRVSVVIKALNEEDRIEAAIRSALAAVEATGGEVILADSASTDRTVEIAGRFPIRIVQLADPRERRCGIGPQLGYQVADGDYVYILDGDMELDPEFLPAAVSALEKDAGLGGVAGLVDEQSEASYQFRGRKRRRKEGIAGPADTLDMGGLYRASALREVGYFSNRNLHAFEEFELGLRLRAHDYRLERLPVRSVLHFGHEEGNWALLKRRWTSRYLDGPGELLRSALGKPWFGAAVWSQKHLLVGLAIWIGLLAGLLVLPLTPWVLGSTLAFTLLLIAVRFRRTRRLSDAAFGQVVWQVTALAMLRGFLSPKTDPKSPVDYVSLPSVLEDEQKSSRRGAAPSAPGVASPSWYPDRPRIRR